MEEDDLADGWFPESVAAGYDTPGGANAPEVVVPMVDVLEDLADGGPVLELSLLSAGVEPLMLACEGAGEAGIYLGSA